MQWVLWCKKGRFGNKLLTFRDTYKLIPKALKDFGAMFKLDQVKEVFPYDYYTEVRILGVPKRIGDDEEMKKLGLTLVKVDLRNKVNEERWYDKNVLSIDEVAKLYLHAPNQKELDDRIRIFKNNCIICKMFDGKFNPRSYCEFYCERDTEVMSQGFKRFYQDTLKTLGLDIRTYLTLPSFAQVYLIKEKCYIKELIKI